MSGYARLQAKTSPDRQRDDFYPTWPAATEALLAVENFGPYVWEPACGEGHMARVIAATGRTVHLSDLVERGFGAGGVDFLAASTLRAPDIITNPPFKHAEAFLHHALDLGARKVALFLRLAFLEGVGRAERVYRQKPPSKIWIMSRRVPMHRGRIAVDGDATGLMAFAWFVWERGRHPEPPGWLDWQNPLKSIGGK